MTSNGPQGRKILFTNSTTQQLPNSTFPHFYTIHDSRLTVLIRLTTHDSRLTVFTNSTPQPLNNSTFIKKMGFSSRLVKCDQTPQNDRLLHSLAPPWERVRVRGCFHPHMMLHRSMTVFSFNDILNKTHHRFQGFPLFDQLNPFNHFFQGNHVGNQPLGIDTLRINEF